MTDDRQPWSLLSQLTIKLAYLGVMLTNDEQQVLQTGLQGATAGLDMYPASTHARLTVSDFDLRGAGAVPMLRTGSREGSEADGSALSVLYVANPQDSQADAVVNISAAPSFVTFDHRCVRDVVHFFKSEQVMWQSSKNQSSFKVNPLKVNPLKRAPLCRVAT